jgi:hypothetical protein
MIAKYLRVATRVFTEQSPSDQGDTYELAGLGYRAAAIRDLREPAIISTDPTSRFFKTSFR